MPQPAEIAARARRLVRVAARYNRTSPSPWLSRPHYVVAGEERRSLCGAEMLRNAFEEWKTSPPERSTGTLCGNCAALLARSPQRVLALATPPDPAAWLHVRARGAGTVRVAPEHTFAQLALVLLAFDRSERMWSGFRFYLPDGRCVLSSLDLDGLFTADPDDPFQLDGELHTLASVVRPGERLRYLWGSDWLLYLDVRAGKPGLIEDEEPTIFKWS